MLRGVFHLGAGAFTGLNDVDISNSNSNINIVLTKIMSFILNYPLYYFDPECPHNRLYEAVV